MTEITTVTNCYTRFFGGFEGHCYFVGGVVVAFFRRRMAFVAFLPLARAKNATGFWLLQLLQVAAKLAETITAVAFAFVTLRLFSLLLLHNCYITVTKKV